VGRLVAVFGRLTTATECLGEHEFRLPESGKRELANKKMAGRSGGN
jgi:hypothetical protein